MGHPQLWLLLQFVAFYVAACEAFSLLSFELKRKSSHCHFEKN
jgi:hypothetical protein